MRKGFKVGLLVISVALCMSLVSATALGATISKTVDVVFKGITIMVNGRQVQADAEPLVFQDRTYVPIRAVAEAMGADVSWDPEKNQVVINGRVRLSPQETPRRECHVGQCYHIFEGLVINNTGKAVSQLAITCKAYAADGKEIDSGSWVLDGEVKPGATQYRLLSSGGGFLWEAPDVASNKCDIVSALQ